MSDDDPIITIPPVIPHGIEEVRAAYGDIKIEIGRGGWNIVEPAGWESANCITATNLPGLGDKKLYMHKCAEDPLRAALNAWQATCPEYAIVTIGCFNPRPKRVVRAAGRVGWDEGLSLHSAGVAFDINAAANPMRRPLTTDMPAAFVKCFTSAGFVWGGGFPTPDPMHFQLASGC